MIANTDCKRYDAFFGKEMFMNRIRDEIDRELSGLTFEKIEKGARGELPEKRKEKKMKFNKKIITGFAAAAAVATVTVTAGAVSDWNYEKLINGFFWHQGVTDDEKAEWSRVDLGGYMQEVTASENTFTEVEASFDGAIYDGKFLMVSVTLCKKDGTPFENASEYDMVMDCSWRGGGTDNRTLREDGSLNFFLTVSDLSLADEESVRVKFSNLTRRTADGEELIDGGAISAEFVPEWCQESRSFTLSDGKDRSVTADVTPISIRISYPSGLLAECGLNNFPLAEISGADGVLIGKWDYHTAGGREDPESDEDFAVCSFAKPIDISEITRIDCGDFSTANAPGRNYDTLIANLFQQQNAADASAAALLDPLVQNAEITGTFTKYDARFDGIVYDGNVLRASVNLAAKDGTPFDSAHEYFGIFLVNGIQAAGGGGCEVKEDGTLQWTWSLDNAEIYEDTEIELSYHYVLCDPDSLRFRPVDELSPEEVLDSGMISAKFTPKKRGIEKNVTLTDGNGNTVSAHITPISMELTFSEGATKVDLPPKYGTIYGKNGEVLIGADNYCHYSHGKTYLRSAFAKILDVNEIAKVVWGDFTYDGDPAPSASAAALLDPLIQNAKITSTFTNYNARFDGIIYDGNVLMASVNLAAKDGTPFDPEHSYSGFFNVKGIGSMSGREWWHVNEDGTLQAYCQFDHADEASEVEISYYYVLQDSEALKFREASELSPEEVLDPGSIIAKLTLEKSEICKDVELKDADGNVINAHITPTSVELIYSEEFIGGRTIESGQIPKYCEIYGKNGEVLLRANDYSGGVGDETGRGYKGVPYFLGTFSRIIDVNEIAGVACGDFSYGEIPG